MQLAVQTAKFLFTRASPGWLADIAKAHYLYDMGTFAQNVSFMFNKQKKAALKLLLYPIGSNP
jgi:hypothetical protein